MNSIFVDTSFVIALVNTRDQHHVRATELADLFDGFHLVTTDAVLFEIGNALAKDFRKQAVEVIEGFRSSAEIEIVHTDAELFAGAFDLYRARTDKKWGMVDCVSFVVMHERGISDALTNDKDFEQAGFTPLMRAGGGSVR